jgi:hypothetical protein
MPSGLTYASGSGRNRARDVGLGAFCFCFSPLLRAYPFEGLNDLQMTSVDDSEALGGPGISHE